LRVKISEICHEAHCTALEKGWYDQGAREWPELLALIHGEVSEALEAYRDGIDSWYVDGKGKPEGLIAELADVIIHIGDAVAARGKGEELESAIVAKLAYNKTRPYRHGGKKA
jgi:hypothetical protein